MSAVEKILKKYSKRLKEEQARKKQGRPSAKTDGQVQTELKMELNALLKKWKKAQAEKEKKPNEQEGSDGEHSPSGGELSAVLWRKSSYNNNMYKYLKKNSGRRKVFEMDGRTSRLGKAYSFHRFVEHFKSGYGFSQRDENFHCNANIDETTAKKKKKKGKTAGNAYPYGWNGHHMIPCGAFYQGQKKSGMIKSVLTDDQYALLLMSDYDVNHGQNVIPLPNKPFYQGIHDQVAHPSSHDNYTKLVQKGIKRLSEKLDELSDDAKKPHPEISVKVAETLAGFENRLWKLLIKLGKEEVDKKLGLAEGTERSYINESGGLK